MRTVLMPTGGYPIAVQYIISYHIIPIRILMTHTGEASNNTWRSGWDPWQGTPMKHIFYWWSSKRPTSLRHCTLCLCVR